MLELAQDERRNEKACASPAVLVDNVPRLGMVFVARVEQRDELTRVQDEIQRTDLIASRRISSARFERLRFPLRTTPMLFGLGLSSCAE